MISRSTFILVACSFLIAGCSGGSSDGEQLPDLSGSIAIETNTRIDLDTADEIRLGLQADNNQPVDAQSLPANATVGGYLSANEAFYSGTASNFFTIAIPSTSMPLT
jgi:serine protease